VHILLLELFDRMPPKMMFLGYLFDGRVTAPPVHMICEPLRVEGVVRNPLKFFLNDLATFSTLHSADFQFEEDPSISTWEVPDPPCPAVVPSSVDSLAATANRFLSDVSVE
jgi:hypothetical protein